MEFAALLEQRPHRAGLRIDFGDRPLCGRPPDLATDENRAAHRPVEIVSQIAEREFGASRGAAVAVELELDDALLAKLRDEQVIARLIDDYAVGHCAAKSDVSARLSRVLGA